MTLDQLKEAIALKEVAEASSKCLKEFTEHKDAGIHRIAIWSDGSGAINIVLGSLGLGDGYSLPLHARPELQAAMSDCVVLLENALQAEANRTAKAFDDFTILP